MIKVLKTSVRLNTVHLTFAELKIIWGKLKGRN